MLLSKQDGDGIMGSECAQPIAGSEGPPHLAGLMIHVKGGDDSIRQLPSLSKHHILGQSVGQVGFPSTTGAGENDAPVFYQQGDVALQDGLGDQGLKH